MLSLFVSGNKWQTIGPPGSDKLVVSQTCGHCYVRTESVQGQRKILRGNERDKGTIMNSFVGTLKKEDLTKRQSERDSVMRFLPPIFSLAKLTHLGP